MENQDVLKSKTKEGTVTSLNFQESVAPRNFTKGKKRLLSKSEKEANEVSLRAQWEKDNEMVRGIFRYHECPGGVLGFPYLKYKYDDMQTYNLKDGEVYELPLMVAKHLNTNGWYPSYNYKNDVNGQPVVSLAEKIRRFSFQSLEFVDIEDPSMKSLTGRKPQSGLKEQSGSSLPR